MRKTRRYSEARPSEEGGLRPRPYAAPRRGHLAPGSTCDFVEPSRPGRARVVVRVVGHCHRDRDCYSITYANVSTTWPSRTCINVLAADRPGRTPAARGTTWCRGLEGKCADHQARVTQDG